MGLGDARPRYRVGEVRPSQVIHTFGIGSLLDLPNISAVVMGLDEWDPPVPEDVVVEDRLLALVRSHLGPSVERLVCPPPLSDEGRRDPFDPAATRGVPVMPFPRWVRCPLCNLIAPLSFGVFSLKTDPWHPDRTRYVHDNCQKAKGRAPAVVPVRFVRACEHGHLDDFPWDEFVHDGKTDCGSLLRLYEFGVSAEAADIVVKCDTCNVSKPMTMAFSDKGKAILSVCSGQHPQLRSAGAKCDAKAKAILSGASNLWFSVTVSALSLPSDQGKLEQLVQEQWPELEMITSTEVLDAFRQRGILQEFASFSSEELWEAIEQRRAGDDAADEPVHAAALKDAEWEVFSNPDPARNGTDFRLVPEPPPVGYETAIERIVRVERLRVVKAQIGFTRILSPGDYADVAEIPEIRRAPLARRPPTWVPATEVRGEGIFIQFREDVLVDWLDDPSVRLREEAMFEAHKEFRRQRDIAPYEENWPGIRYVLLHSFSHALIRQLAIECGYGAASLQERIYARDSGPEGPMAGILLYTAAADAEGTLGGLVSLGKPEQLGRHFDMALEDQRLCASDPLCSEHEPGVEGMSLHGAACHACQFSSETSCERGNKYLDRTLLVETVGGKPAPFFDRYLPGREH